jgi:hypothetical protein
VGAVGKYLWVVLALIAAPGLARQKQMQIQFAEPVQLKASPGSSEFDAYGRRFSLSLERNDRLLAALPAAGRAQLGAVDLVRGNLEGVPGSWVRLTRMASGVEGAIWDGHDLYVISALASIAKNLTTPIDAAPAQTVVYRLSDTLNSLPEAFCGLDDRVSAVSKSSDNGLVQYQALVASLAAAAPTDQLDIAFLADTEFQQQNGGATLGTMLARLNFVDGIFSEQLGVLLSPTEFRLMPSGSDPFNSTNPSQLLAQLAALREQTPELRTPGLAHLFTGKDLDGDTIGIGYLNTLCDPNRGASLSDNELGSFAGALVMAHELGHNFGAEHDGVSGSACAATGSGYLMSPSYNSSAVFSQCSRQTMAQSVARARGICIKTPNYADLAASSPATLDVEANTVFTLPVTVRSLGNAAALESKLRLTLPATLSFEGAVLSGGTCTAAGADVTCALGEVAGGTETVVEIKLKSSQLTSVSVIASVSASNDHLVSNATTQTSLRFSSPVDLKVSMNVAPDTAFANDGIDITIDVSSLRSQTAQGGLLYVDLGGLKFDSVDAGAHACAPYQFYAVRCELADLSPGATTRIVLHVHGEIALSSTVFASVQLTGDGDSTNNSASDSITVRAEREVNISVSRDSLRFVTGVIQELTFTITAGGRLPSQDVEFSTSPPWNGVLNSVVPSAGTCPPLDQISMRCSFGTLAPGETRTVVVRFNTISSGTSILRGLARFQSGPNQVTDRAAYSDLYSNLLIDAIANAYFASTLEGVAGSGYANLQSVGVQPAQNVVATLEVPPELRLTEISMAGVNTWTCSLLSPQRARCTGAFTDVGGASLNYSFVSDVPGYYGVRLSVTADGDLNSSNDTSDASLQIDPYRDAAIATTETALQITAGQDRLVNFTVTTKQRAVPGVVVVAQGGPQIVAMSASGSPCTLESSNSARCNLGDLDSNAAFLVTVTYRATTDNQNGSASVLVRTTVDHNQTNNAVHVPYTTIALTDVRLQVAQTSATAVSGTHLRFPLVTVTNGSYVARDVTVQIPLPVFTSIVSISANANCSGVTLLICNLFPLQPGETQSLDLTLTTLGAGTFASNVSLQAGNDSTSGNNAAVVNLNVTAPAPIGGGGNPAGGGKGGGGRFEWLALGLLAVLGANRTRRARLQPRVMSRH